VSDILANQGRWGRPFASTTHAGLPAALAHAEWWWKCVLRAWAFRCGPARAGTRAPPQRPQLQGGRAERGRARARRGGAVVCAALSLAVTVAEVTVSDRLPNLSVFAAALHAAAGHEASVELLALAFLVPPAPPLPLHARCGRRALAAADAVLWRYGVG